MKRHHKLFTFALLVGLLAVFAAQFAHAATAPAPAVEDSVRNSIDKNFLSNVTPTHLYASADAWLKGQTGYTFESIWTWIKNALIFIFTKTIELLKKLLSYIQ